MKIVKEYPPNIDKIREKFKLHEGVIFTYGDTIYNPDGGFIDRALEIHEETHTKQQGNNIEEWWDKYLTDDEFRLSQEVEAYRNKYKKMKSNIKDVNKLNFRLDLIAKDLASEMYGSIVSYEEAKSLIELSTVK